MRRAGDREPLALVEAGLRAACARAASARVSAGFELYRIADEHPFLRSLALPCGGEPPDWAGPLDELVRVCAVLQLVPRIELLAERQVGLRAALATGGWVRTLAVPVLAAPATRGPPTRGEVLQLDAVAAEDRLAATLAEQHAILGAAPPSAAERARFRACLADGSVRTWVRLDEGGRPVAAASLLGGPPAVELAGLWTRPDCRRSGLATSLARAALAGAAETGARLVWAGAASPASEGLLRGLGMTEIGTLESWERRAAG